MSLAPAAAYIREQRGAHSDAEIISSLRAGGYSEDQISQAFQLVGGDAGVTPTSSTHPALARFGGFILGGIGLYVGAAIIWVVADEIVRAIFHLRYDERFFAVLGIIAICYVALLLYALPKRKQWKSAHRVLLGASDALILGVLLAVLSVIGLAFLYYQFSRMSF